MSRFDEPEADWTDEYTWTRYRGPQPYPCPGGWVLNIPEMMAVSWVYFPDIGSVNETESDVRDAFGMNDDGYEDARSAEAFLLGDTVGPISEETICWQFTIDGEEVFERVDPDHDDLYGAVAEALAKHSRGESFEDVSPKTGRLTEAEQKQRETDQRRESNQSLGDFG
jgi:hypothetical protein